jgi:type IV secretion system protein VirB10
MTPQPRRHDDEDHDDAGLAPLPGEPGIPSVAAAPRTPQSWKALAAPVLLVFSLAVVVAASIQRFVASGQSPESEEPHRVGERPSAASMQPRTLEVPAPVPALPASPAPAEPAPRIPAIVPIPEDTAEPIGVRRSGPAPTRGTKPVAPEDAPVLLLSTRPGSATAPAAAGGDAPNAADPLLATQQNLEAYQRQLQDLLETLTRSTQLATGQASSGEHGAGGPTVGGSPDRGSPVGGSPLGGPPAGGPPLAGRPSAGSPTGHVLPSGALLGGQLPRSATPRATAAMLGHRSLTLPKGTSFTCALKTRIVSAASGLVGCQVQRNVYSDDGRVLLIERGSHLDGEYRVTSVRPGAVRIPVLWTRLRTPHGVTVDLDSPATGALGEAGVDGHVDNRWPERIGAALLLSLIDDAVQLVVQNQASERQADTIVLSSTTERTRDLAEMVLESTVDIPPLIYRNQGGIVGIVVARDVDFSSVYDLALAPR